MIKEIFIKSILYRIIVISITYKLLLKLTTSHNTSLKYSILLEITQFILYTLYEFLWSYILKDKINEHNYIEK